MSVIPFTILIPTYNPGGHLHHLLLGIARATQELRFPVRVEISDDRSPHGLPDWNLAIAVGQQLSVHLHTNELNLGEGGNVNQAMIRLAAEGREWVMLLHQDDLVAADWLKTCHDYCEGWSSGKPEMMFAENTGIYSVESLPAACGSLSAADELPFVDIPAFQAGLDYVSEHWAWIPSGTFFRTSAYNAMHGFYQKLRYAGDNDFMVRWLLSGNRVRQVRRKLIYKLIHQSSSSSRCIVNGWDTDGWCYLMQRYSVTKTAVRNRQDHVHWIWRDFRILLTALKQFDTQTVVSRIRGVTVGLLSLAAFYFPACLALLPSGIRQLLRDGPAIVVVRR